MDDKIYFSPDRSIVTRGGAYVYTEDSQVLLPAYGVDEKGIFTFCKQKDVNRAAEEHYKKSREALVDAVEQSMAAGVLLPEFPPLGAIAGYKAVQSWKEAAEQYNAGVEAEKQETEQRKKK